ncbi:MAG: hypothetical protein AAGI46_09055 [Planctomycetota bacterium]
MASDTLLKVRIWTKVTLLSIVAIYTIVFVLLNGRGTIDVWLFPTVTLNTSPIVGLLAAFVLGALAMLLTRMAFATLRQAKTAREKGRTDRLEREIQEMKLRASSPTPTKR